MTAKTANDRFEISLDDPLAIELGFTSDRFQRGSYLWRDGASVVISFIYSLHRGAFRRLCENILARGWSVKIPTPSARMREIVNGAGYEQTFVYDEVFGEDVELWVKHPEAA